MFTLPHPDQRICLAGVVAVADCPRLFYKE